MKTAINFIAIMASTISLANAYASITTGAVATGCGTNTCCIPDCTMDWNDGSGCNGQADWSGVCQDAFVGADETHDTGVGICGNAGAYLCENNGGFRVAYVVNGDNTVNAHKFPSSYSECTLRGQCAPCDRQASCGDAYVIGNTGDHSCASFNGLLAQSGVTLPDC